MAFHHSRKEFYRKPFGACETGQEVRLRLDVPATATAVTLRLWYSDGGEVLVPMTMLPVEGEIPPMVTYEAKFLTNGKPGWVWYYFIIEEKNRSRYNDGSHVVRYYYGNNEKVLGGKGQDYSQVPPAYQITVYKKNLGIPEWTKDSVMYHIFVDRFRRGGTSPSLGTNLKVGQVAHAKWNDEPLYGRDEKGNVLQYDFFGGDLQGIIDALPYLQSLGVNLLYLSPIMDSVSNHKYDVGDYKKVDPAFGNERIFRLLTAKAHAHGMKVILDGVFSHNGADSIYFNRFGKYDSLGAYQSKESPYYEWYTFQDYPNTYDCWWGMTNMPNVKEDTPSYLNYMLWNWDSVINHWNSFGIDGWRLDVADELPNTFLQPFRQAVKQANKEAFILGEVWEDASHKEAYGELRPYLQGEELDSVMNYPFRHALINTLLGRISPEEGLNTLYSLHENYPRHTFFSLMNLLSSHDERRILTELGEAPDMDGWTSGERRDYRLPPEKLELGKKRLKLALLWQFTFPGIPDIYYGDEAAMEGDKDPFNRRTYPWGKEDISLRKWVALLGNLRHRHFVLRRGCLEPILDKQMVSFKRTTEKGLDAFGDRAHREIAYVYLNINEEYRERNITLEANYNWTLYRIHDEDTYISDDLQLGEGTLIHNGDGRRDITLNFEAYEGMLIIGEYCGIEEDIHYCHDFGKKPVYHAHPIHEEAETGEERVQTISDLGEYRQRPHRRGILLHPTALPAQDGIGDLGHVAYEWVDYLVGLGQDYWQILPLTEPALANSPYTAYSAVAGDTRLISLDSLANFDLIDRDELEAARRRVQFTGDYIDPKAVMAFKEPFYKKAFATFKALRTMEKDVPKTKTQESLLSSYKTFRLVNEHWLEKYTLFQAMKMVDKTKPWTEWGKMADYEEAHRYRKDLSDNIDYATFLQWVFYRQWQALHSYANEKGIYIIGDLPFFMAFDSADVWAHRDLFDLDTDGQPKTVAGVPPDYFCKDGQHWGNPQYNWKHLCEKEYEWWIQNVDHILTLVDVLRLDHFRGYESYWSIPRDAETAATGCWEAGPGMDLFKTLHKRMMYRNMNGYEGDVLIAEDLGLITEDVEKLRRDAGLLGMRVLQFSFSEDPLPFSDIFTRVVYTGTHDNNTLMGWLEELDQNGDTYTKKQLTEYLSLPFHVSREELACAILREAYTMNAAITIIPIQDLLGFGAEARFNIPGVVNDTNWLWRLPGDYQSCKRLI